MLSKIFQSILLRISLKGSHGQLPKGILTKLLTRLEDPDQGVSVAVLRNHSSLSDEILKEVVAVK